MYILFDIASFISCHRKWSLWKKKHFFENDIMAVATFTNEYRRPVTTPKKKTLCGLHSGHTQYEQEAQRERSRTLFLFLNRKAT